MPPIRLLELFPQAASEKDSDGRLPVHYAAGSEPDTDVIIALLEVKTGGTLSYALHFACSCLACVLTSK